MAPSACIIGRIEYDKDGTCGLLRSVSQAYVIRDGVCAVFSHRFSSPFDLIFKALLRLDQVS
jgi:hypothetical protein